MLTCPSKLGLSFQLCLQIMRYTLAIHTFGSQTRLHWPAFLFCHSEMAMSKLKSTTSIDLSHSEKLVMHMCFSLMAITR